jgi:regulatory protein
VQAWVGDRPAPQPPSDLPPDTEAEGPDADPESVARTILLDQLTGRARSRQELSAKLASRRVPDEIATRLLDRFEEVGLVDDGAFARTWVSQRQPAAGGGKGLARRALAQELRRKGVDDQTAREVLDELDPAAEETAARELVRRKLRSLTRVDDATATRRLVGMLARKGYPSGVAFSVVRDELAAAGRDQPEEPHST